MDFSNIILVAIVALIILFGLYVLLHKKKRFQTKDIQYISRHWKQITQEKNNNPEHAIMNADKLLSFALKKAGFNGSVAEQLKKAKAIFSDLDGIWSAHKLRNKIAHEVGFSVSDKESNYALNQFKKAFKDLGISL